MKILFINNQFERGGAARVAAILCNELSRRGHNIHVVTDWLNFKHTYVIDSNIPIHEIKIYGAQRNIFGKLKKWLKCSYDIRMAIKKVKPDIIIATESMMFLCAWLANIGIKTPIFAADHTSFNRKIDLIIDFVRYKLYAKADGLSILTMRDKKILGDKFPRKKVIYNPLPFTILNHEVKRRKNILCAGRLEVWKIKGFDIILKIWADIQHKYPDWTLEIAGSANNQTSYEYMNKLIEELKLANRVKLLGQVDDMQSLYSESSIFALPSRIEGFPMVLMEAMSQGCACVAYSISGASEEMMKSDSGIIVKDGDIESFKTGLEKLLISDDLRSHYSFNSMKDASRFSVEAFIASWESYINEILSM